MRRVWRTLAGLLVSLTLTVALIAAAEFGAGLFLRHRQQAEAGSGFRGDAVDLAFFSMDFNPAPLVVDADLLWRNEAGARKTRPVNPQVLGRDDTWKIAIDEQGFRDTADFRPGVHPGVYRVLCIGDSITFGFNVDQSETYPAQLAALLRARHPGRSIEVINAGVPGWSWAQGRRFFELEGAALAPDVVVIAHGTNDQFFPVKTTDAERLGGTGFAVRARRRLTQALMRSNLYWTLMVLSPPRMLTTSSPGCLAQEREIGTCRRVSVREIETTVGDVHRLATAAAADLIVMNLDFMQTRAVEGMRAGAVAAHVPLLDFPDRFTALTTADDARRADTRALAPAGPRGDAHDGPRTVVFRVIGPRRDAAYAVQGSAWFTGKFPFEAPLVDDGTHGDEVAGDGVFSGTIELSPLVDKVEYRFTENGAPELVPLPPLPSRNGFRVLATKRDTLGPVEAFGDLGLMVERTHPNARGHAVVAAAVADAIAALPSFGAAATAH